jgi:phosphoenolpyruvate carboxylase
MRPFLARSDPALVSGLLATVIANKLALSRVYEFSEKTGIAMYPISGVGSLPFRGGLTPATIDSYMEEYPGMRTVSIQSSFRYDHPLASVKAAIKKLEAILPTTKPNIMDKDDQRRLEAIGKKSATLYQETLTGIAKDLGQFFAAVPRRRDRRQHIGLLAYGRTMGQQKMPRAITFTSGFYSIGVPPEFIGIGRTLKQLSASDVELIKGHYRNLVSDLQWAGRYLNTDNLAKLAASNPAWKQIQMDVESAEAVLGITFGPHSKDEQKHHKLSSDALLIRDNKEVLTDLIEKMARLRRSLG